MELKIAYDEENCNEIRTRSKQSVYHTNQDIKVFPNPSSSFIEVQSPYIIKELKVYDLNHNLLLATTESRADISSLSAGIYICEVRGKDSTIIGRQKIVISK